MIRQIVLKNFMSHRETVIDLADGLTALIGPNNSGKSAIVAALDILCNGARGADFVIRHGASYAEISVTTEEGDIFNWRRRRSDPKNRWLMNGKAVSKNEKPSEDWNRRLRLQRVQVQLKPSEFIDPHLSDQKEPIFLLKLTSSGPKSARFFASNGSVADLLRMQKLNKERQTKRQQEKADEERKQEKANEEIKKLQDVPLIGARWRGLDVIANSVRKGMAKAKKLRDTISKLQSQERDVATRRQRYDALATLGEPPHPSQLKDTVELASVIETWNQVEKDTQDQREQVRHLNENLKSCREELVRFIRAHPMCPTCNQPLALEQIIKECAHE